MGFAVIAGQLFSGLNVLLGIELNSAVGDSNEQVWIAGMIHELEWATVHTAVHGFRCADLNNDDSVGMLGSPPRFTNRNQLSGELSQLCSFGNRLIAEKALALNKTLANGQHLNPKDLSQ